MSTDHHILAGLVYVAVELGLSHKTRAFDLFQHDLLCRSIESYSSVKSPDPGEKPTVGDVTRRVHFLLGRHSKHVKRDVEVAPGAGNWNLRFFDHLIRFFPRSRPHPTVSSCDEKDAIIQLVEFAAEETWRSECHLPLNLPDLMDKNFLVAWLVALGRPRRDVKLPGQLVSLFSSPVTTLPRYEEMDPAVDFSNWASRSTQPEARQTRTSSPDTSSTENNGSMTPCTEISESTALDEDEYNIPALQVCRRRRPRG